MKKFNQSLTKVKQFGVIVKIVDQRIEEWVHHFISQIEHEKHNQSNQK